MSNQMIYNGKSIHVRWLEQTWQNQGHYAKRNKIDNQYSQHVDILNEYGNEAQRK